MSIKFFAPHWGNVLPFDSFCQNVKAAGYNGVEMALPFAKKEKEETIAILKTYDLELIGQYYQSFERDLQEHLQSYEKHLWNLVEVEPLFINCQTGKDYYTFEQNQTLFEAAARIARESSVRIIHETHRGKSLFAAHITQEYLTYLPDLRICLDISHWCAVHESLLDDQNEAVSQAISRTDHIHSRVGFPEGPQVNDPRASEWAETLNAHLTWWDRVVEKHRAADTRLTINTEFGPAPYMPQQPHTQEPLASQWDVNVFMMRLLKERYDLG
ncbi:sugar phosphate isomerase/epimerase family protein [Telluribacter sp.]|jgi:sugar phosphate isomerase/epimerase|uniref:sugar phosphate isomerase/epimerase family protein n=1 Tax=Telluribacter sp. TaxID=1978767 RepID=UPI002E103B02|nr:TIM barrel protein [Telluribacter sp.]